MSIHVLVVEDEPAIAEMIQISLRRNGYGSSLAADVASAREIVNSGPVDLALVDWMLPGASGIEFVRYLRGEDATRSLPIIMLTAKSDEQDITAGLDAGADDYMAKPFSPNELNSRIKALLRRSHSMSNVVLEVGNLRCDTSAHRLFTGDTAIEIGTTEFKLLQFLMRNPDRVYTRAQLLDNVWGRSTFIEERTIDVHILRLRKILKQHGHDSLIQTVRGAGYRLSETS